MKAKTLKERFRLASRHKWFAHIYRDAEDGWVGPCATIGEAVLMSEETHGDWHESVFVAQGRKLKKREIEDMDVEYTWEVDSHEAFEIVITPNMKADADR